jgi:hypothetical protein
MFTILKRHSQGVSVLQRVGLCVGATAVQCCSRPHPVTSACVLTDNTTQTITIDSDTLVVRAEVLEEASHIILLTLSTNSVHTGPDLFKPG